MLFRSNCDSIRIRISRKRKADQSLEQLVHSMSNEDHEKFMFLVRRKRTRDNENSLMEKLPREIWLTILGNLKQKDLVNMSMTCKHFRDVCLSIMSEIFLPLKTIVHDTDFVTQFLSRCSQLKSIEVEDIAISVFEIDSIVSESKGKLESCLQAMKIGRAHV